MVLRLPRWPDVAVCCQLRGAIMLLQTWAADFKATLHPCSDFAGTALSNQQSKQSQPIFEVECHIVYARSKIRLQLNLPSWSPDSKLRGKTRIVISAAGMRTKWTLHRWPVSFPGGRIPAIQSSCIWSTRFVAINRTGHSVFQRFYCTLAQIIERTTAAQSLIVNKAGVFRI